MRNKKLIPFEVIEKTIAGEPDAIDAVLRHYTGRIKYLSTYRGHIKTEKAVKDKMHACASLTAFPVFAVGQLRERNRIDRLRSLPLWNVTR